jgi:hypothetical protein
MGIALSIASGDSAAIPDASSVAAFLDVSENGAGNVYAFNPGDDVAATLGDGKGTERVLYHLRNGGVGCLYAGAAKTDGAIGSVTKSGSGPTVTAALTSGYTGPLRDLNIKAKVTLGGANGTGTIAVAFDAATYAYDYRIPTETPAVLLGTVDLAALDVTTLDADTLIFTAPAAFTCTFATPVTSQDLVDQFNAQAITATSVLRAEISETAAGEEYFRIYTTSTGSGVTATISASSTGETILGFAGAGLTATGAPATLALPHTAVTLTFPADVYVKDTVYTIPTTGPTASISALLTAADNLRAWSQTNVEPFGFIVAAQPASTAGNARALADALDARLVTWASDTAAPIFPHYLLAAPFHTASATAATNATNVATADQALIAAFNTPSAVHVSNNTIANGDGYATGSRLIGKYRESGCLALAARRAFGKLSQDPGDGALRGLPEWSMVGPDGVTEARDETRSTNVVKMGGSRGSGFTVFGTKAGTARVMRGVTRAGQSSRFVDLGVIAPTLRAATVLHAAAQFLENSTFVTSGGKLTEGEREALNTGLTAQLGAAVVEAPNDHFSSATVAIDSTEVIASTRNLTYTATLEALGQGENITVQISTVGLVSIAAPVAA